MELHNASYDSERAGIVPGSRRGPDFDFPDVDGSVLPGVTIYISTLLRRSRKRGGEALLRNCIYRICNADMVAFWAERLPRIEPPVYHGQYWDRG